MTMSNVLEAAPLPQLSPTALANREKFWRAEALVADGRLAEAETLLAELISAEETLASAQALYCRVLLRSRKNAQALAAARAAAAANARDPRLHAVLGHTLLRLDRVAEACRHLEATLADFPENASLLALDAEALLKSGETARAQQSIERACELDPASAAHPALKIAILCVAPEMKIPQSLLLCADQTALVAAARDTAGYFHRHGKRDLETALLKRTLALLPNAVPLRVLQAERLLSANRPADARAVLDENAVALETLAPDQAAWFLKTAAAALRAMKDRDGAIAEFEKALAFNPEDEDALRALYMLHQQLGRTAEMRSYARRLAGAGARKMPATLAQGLEALGAGGANLMLERDKLDWAWAAADKSEWQRERWVAAVEWGRRADNLLRAWWLNLPERSAELAALIDPPERAIADLVPADTRCLSITTHLGPMAGYVHYMQNCGRPFRGFGFAGPDPAIGDAPSMRIASNSVNRAGALRELVEEIRNGTVIGFAQDTPGADEGLRFELLGWTVWISTLVPRLIAKHRTASLWCQPLWRGKRIVLEIERLPDPQDDETPEQWHRRWCQAYLAKIEPVMRGAPQNLNLGPGIWLNVRRGSDGAPRVEPNCGSSPAHLA